MSYTGVFFHCFKFCKRRLWFSVDQSGDKAPKRATVPEVQNVPFGYPDIGSVYILPAPPHTLIFLLHTYLVGETAIKKAVLCYVNSALHIAEAHVVELSSGISLA